ncbi:MAG TPA: hypothetical protein VG755_45125 [Nannocystaceae bacterium]|nr:hypothetical protein [Nannocystaceae bacterium]
MSTAGEASNLSRLFRGLEALYGADSGLDPHALLVTLPTGDHDVRERVLLREAEDGALELGLALDERTLRSLESADGAALLSDDGLGHTLPVLEGLSHVVYLAEAARRERPVSGLELETQAEVDKLAMCLLHRWPDARAHFERLVDRLYYRFELVAHADLHERYNTANRLALAFSRRLEVAVKNARLEDLRRLLQRFWSASMADKLALAA